MDWKPISTAPTDGSVVVVYTPERDGFRSMVSLCAYHEDAGWCTDELREPTHWVKFSPPPITAETCQHRLFYSHHRAGAQCDICGHFVSDFL